MIILGIVILLATVYALIKQYETKMILFASGLLQCILGGSPMNAFEAFATRMTTGSLFQPILSVMGFAYVMKAQNVINTWLIFFPRDL